MFKAWLVAKRLRQVQGVDYCGTFSLVVRYESIRILFGIAAQAQLMVHQMLKEEICMMVPDAIDKVFMVWNKLIFPVI